MRLQTCSRQTYARLAWLFLVFVSSRAIADETVTLTTFFPQQPAQDRPLAAAVNLNPGTPVAPASLQITTTSAGRLLILWTIDCTPTGGAAAVTAQVLVGGAPTGGVATLYLPVLNQAGTLSGYTIVVPATAGSTTVDLQLLTATAGVTVNGANTKLGVVELK